MLSSYPSIYNLGHKAVLDIFNTDNVVMEEKVDGSQFSFGLDDRGALQCKSKSANIDLDNPNKLFAGAVDTAKQLATAGKLKPGRTYRAEALCRPKHNVLKYDRRPTGDIILFDVDDNNQNYLLPAEKKVEGDQLGLEVVPTFHFGKVNSWEEFKHLMDRESVLGGCKIEGVVIKNYDLFGPDKKVLMAKFVSEAFKEVHRREWKNNNPTKGDVIQQLCDELRTQQRWEKAVIHLHERGELTDTPKDIGALMKEVSLDVLKEEKDYIVEKLFNFAWPKISRAIVGGLPQWYKELLAKQTFKEAA